MNFSQTFPFAFVDGFTICFDFVRFKGIPIHWSTLAFPLEATGRNYYTIISDMRFISESTQKSRLYLLCNGRGGSGDI